MQKDTILNLSLLHSTQSQHYFSISEGEYRTVPGYHLLPEAPVQVEHPDDEVL
jgi:hypothetical protein